MRVLDLDSPCPEWVEERTYADGQPEFRLRILPRKIESVVVYASLTSPRHFLRLAVLLEMLGRHGIPYVLRLGYVLGGRSDRVFNGVTGVAIEAIGRMLSRYTSPYVQVLDPHSDVTLSALSGARSIQHRGLYHHLPEKTTLIIPDRGATYRVGEVMKHTPLPFIQGIKIRGSEGAPQVSLPPSDLSGRTAVIVDDLCDGGRTFISIAEQCRASGAAGIELRVTFGLFTYGVQPLLDAGITKIVCTDAIMLRSPYDTVQYLDWREAWSDFIPPR